MNETIKTIQNHRSIRNFLQREVEDSIIDTILQSAQSMPNSINGQQVSAIVIKDKAKKEKMAELAGGQSWVAAAPVFIVFVMDFYKSNLAAKKNGLTQVIHESAEGTLVGAFDGGLAMGGAIVAAESLGLGIVPIGGVRKNPDEVIKLLDLPEYVFPLVGLAIGYPADNSEKKPRLPFSTFKHEEVYHTEGLETAIEEYDETMEGYLKEIGREAEGNWSKYTSGIYQYIYYPKVYQALKEQLFKNDK